MGFGRCRPAGVLQRHLPPVHILETLPPDIAREARDNYRAAARAQRECSRSRARTDATAWCKWLEFCTWITVAPDLRTVSDPVPLLQIFTARVRAGILAAGGKQVAT